MNNKDKITAILNAIREANDLQYEGVPREGIFIKPEPQLNHLLVALEKHENNVVGIDLQGNWIVASGWSEDITN